MEKKYYRAVTEPIVQDIIYDTKTINYGNSFGDDKFGHFLKVYGKIMSHVNLPVDFLINVNNNISMMGGLYMEVLNKAIGSSGNLNLYKISPKPEYLGYQMPVDLLNDFLQSFDEANPFEFFDSGPELWEFYLEKVRIKKFRGYPSRLFSAFFFTNKNDAETFIQKSFGHVCEVEILEVRNMLELDMQIIDDLQTTISRDELYQKLNEYWSGDITGSAVKEVVFQGKFKLLEM